MSTTLTLKNIPDNLYVHLKEVAVIHRRSLNNEVITCLENVLLSKQITVEERLLRARELRSLPISVFSAEDIANTIELD